MFHDNFSRWKFGPEAPVPWEQYCSHMNNIVKESCERKKRFAKGICPADNLTHKTLGTPQPLGNPVAVYSTSNAHDGNADKELSHDDHLTPAQSVKFVHVTIIGSINVLAPMGTRLSKYLTQLQ